jgi:hypothetical protein
MGTRSPSVIEYWSLVKYIRLAADEVALAVGMDLARRYFGCYRKRFEALKEKRLRELSGRSTR